MHRAAYPFIADSSLPTTISISYSSISHHPHLLNISLLRSMSDSNQDIPPNCLICFACGGSCFATRLLPNDASISPPAPTFDLLASSSSNRHLNLPPYSLGCINTNHVPLAWCMLCNKRSKKGNKRDHFRNWLRTYQDLSTPMSITSFILISTTPLPTNYLFHYHKTVTYHLVFQNISVMSNYQTTMKTILRSQSLKTNILLTFWQVGSSQLPAHFPLLLE